MVTLGAVSADPQRRGTPAAPGAGDHSPASRLLAAVTVSYTLLAIALTFPLCLRMGSAIVHDPGDPILNTWLLWWNAHHIPLTQSWWNAPIFYPTENTIAFSETLAGLSPWTSPVIWLSGNPLFAYNLVLLLSYPACGLGAWWLCWTLTRRADVSWLAGLAFAFAPYRVDQLPHIQMLATWWVPLVLVTAHRYLTDGRRRWLACLALSWALLGATNGYLLLFLSVFFGLWLVWFAHGPWRSRLGPLAAAWTLGWLTVIPILLRYRDVQGRLELRRPYEEMLSYSADVSSLVRGADLLTLGHRWLLPQGTENNLFPGLVLGLGVPACLLWLWWRQRGDASATPPASASGVSDETVATGHARLLTMVFRLMVATSLVLTLIAVSITVMGPWRVAWGPFVISALGAPRAAGLALSAWLLCAALCPPVRRLWRSRSVVAFYLLATPAILLLSMGPEIRFEGVTLVSRAPYYWLLRLPGFDGLRVPGRFAMLATLTLPVCGALLLARLLPSLGRLRFATVALLGVGIVADGWVSAFPLVDPPRPLQLIESSVRGPLIELPLGHAPRDLAAMYRQMTHGQALVNGFSGYLAPYYDILAIAIDEDRDHDALAQLAARGVRYAVVDQRSDPEGLRERFVASAPFARFVARQNAHVVFALDAPTPSLAPPPGTTAMAIESIVDERGRAVATAVLTDHNPTTAWQSDGPQAGRESLMLMLAETAPLVGLDLTHGPYRGGYPRGLVVETSQDGVNWQTQFTGRVLAQLVGSVMDDARLGRVHVDLHGAVARYVRLRQSGETPKSTWALADIDILRGRSN